MQTIKFNTGRDYSVHGQRIAATRTADGHIIAMDVDRHIDFMLPATIDLTQADIMWAYDRNICIFPNEVDMPYGDYYDTVRALATEAETL